MHHVKRHFFSQISLPLTPYMSLVPAAQSTPTSYTSEESTSSKDLSKEPSIFREELISKDNVVIESTKPENQEAQDGLRSGSSQLEETTRPTTSAGMSQGRRKMSWEVVSRGRQGRQ
jgi:hypothetical protein